VLTYDYQAYDKQGRLVRGSINADSERLARRALKDDGLLPLELRAGRERRRWQLRGATRLKPADLSLLIRQLATLVNSGLPLDESLALIADQSENQRQQRLVQEWRSELLQGHSLSAAMQRTPGAVPESLVAAVAVGEETGHLPSVLSRLADELEVGSANRQALAKGLVYPAVMLGVALVVIVIMMIYVVPQVTRVFSSMHQQLPLLTRVMIWLSEGLQAWGWLLALLLAAAVAGAAWWLRDPGHRLAWHRRLLRLPKVGQWLMMADWADWCRNLGTLLASGVPALVALRIAGTVVGNLYLRAQLEQVTERVRQGTSLHLALKEESPAPGFLLHMVSSGEASSELHTMLLRVAEYYSTRLRNAVDTLLKLLEPLLVVAMGGIVLLIVGAILVPIVQMNQMI